VLVRAGAVDARGGVSRVSGEGVTRGEGEECWR